MKLVKDKYGRTWLKRYSAYILLNINHTGLLSPVKEISQEDGNKKESPNI